MAEREKRRATTFRTSRGAIVNVSYPDIYIAPSIVPEDLREALRKELDLHSTFENTRFSREGVDSHFNAVVWHPTGGGAVKASDYWSHISGYDGNITVPATLSGINLIGKRCLDYPFITFRCKLPSVVGNQSVHMGCEDGSDSGVGVARFLYHIGGPPFIKRFMAGSGGPWDTINYLDLTSALPANAETAYHNYTVVVTKSLVEFYIDTSLVAVFVNSPNLSFGSAIANYPPYGVWNTWNFMSPKLPAHIQVTGSLTNFSFPLSPMGVRFTDGDPLPPRTFPLYDAGTLNRFAGLVVAAGSKTSHPVPTLGYALKTFYFQANQAGVVTINVLTLAGNWITYDSVDVSANTLKWYTMTGQAVLARLTYTPTTYPATISEGELVLG